MPLPSGVVTAFLRPGLTMLRPSGVLKRMKCFFYQPNIVPHLFMTIRHMFSTAHKTITSALHPISSAHKTITTAPNTISTESRPITSALHPISTAHKTITSALRQLSTAFRPRTTPKGQSMSNRGRRNAVTTPPASRALSMHPEGAQRRTQTAPIFQDKGNPITRNTKTITGLEKIIPVIIYFFPVIIYFFPGIIFPFPGTFFADYAKAANTPRRFRN